MKRYALIILVLVILVVNSLMQQAAYANPLTNPDLWELRFALPAGVAAAGLLVAAAGLGAQVWGMALPLCGAGWAPSGFWQRLAHCGLWCGWLPMLCAQTYTAGANMLPLGAPSHRLLGGFVVLVLCRMLGSVPLCRRWGVRLISALVAAAAAVLCGVEFCPAAPLCPLVVGLALAPALRLLTAGRPQAPQLVWTLVAALAFCAYTAAFGHLLSWYAPGAESGATPWGGWMGGVFLVIALATAGVRPLRHARVALRVLSAVSLLSCVVWLWLLMAPAQRVLPAQQPASVGFYAASLVLLAIPALLMLVRRNNE